MTDETVSGYSIEEKFPSYADAFRRAEELVEEIKRDGLGRHRDLPTPGARKVGDRWEPFLITGGD
jgi:hypothetical protein